MLENYSIAVTCKGKLDRDDNEAKMNLLQKLINLAAIGYVVNPDYEIRKSGSTGITEFYLVVMCDETNTHEVTEVADVYLSTRCFF